MHLYMELRALSDDITLWMSGFFPCWGFAHITGFKRLCTKSKEIINLVKEVALSGRFVDPELKKSKGESMSVCVWCNCLTCNYRVVRATMNMILLLLYQLVTTMTWRISRSGWERRKAKSRHTIDNIKQDWCFAGNYM